MKPTCQFHFKMAVKSTRINNPKKLKHDNFICTNSSTSL
jgi:hypothetical protein